jgi:hypothetical protein
MKADKQITKKRTTPEKTDVTDLRMPCAPTIFRTTLVKADTGDIIRKITMKLSPLLMLRDGPAVKRIRQAQTTEELLDLIPLATGLAGFTWDDRIRAFGVQALPAMRAHLLAAGKLQDAELRHQVYEKIIVALRWLGDDGGKTLLGCFDGLDDYGKSLACVVLGLLGVRAAADRLWAFYERSVRKPKDHHFVGALWGLTDLHDERAGAALTDLLERDRGFYELYGLLALAGGARAVLPLVLKAEQAAKDDNLDPMMALVAIGHRIGRAALIAELARTAVDESERAVASDVADAILSKPADWPEAHFEAFFHGFNPQAAEALLTAKEDTD